MAKWPNHPPGARTLRRPDFLCLEFGLKLVSSAAATILSLLGGCRIRDIPLLFAVSIPFVNFENQQQDKATDTRPNKPVRDGEQNISIRNIGVRPSFDAFDQVVPAGPPRHRLPPSVTGNKAVMNEVGDSDKAFGTPRQCARPVNGGFQGALAGLNFC